MGPDEPKKLLGGALCGYDVYSVEGSRVAEGLTAKAAADLLEVDRFELIWAVEEFGRCDTDKYFVILSDLDP